MDDINEVTVKGISKLIRFSFFVFGVSAISGWNATLTELDYFNEQFKGINIINKF